MPALQRMAHGARGGGCVACLPEVGLWCRLASVFFRPIMKAIDEQQQQRGLIEKREQIVREKDKQKRGVANKLRNKKSRLEALQQRAPVDRQEVCETS